MDLARAAFEVGAVLARHTLGQPAQGIGQLPKLGSYPYVATRHNKEILSQ